VLVAALVVAAVVAWAAFVLLWADVASHAIPRMYTAAPSITGAPT
jgi:hypothetical protein